MKKVNFYWIIVAMMVLGMSNVPTENINQIQYNSREKAELSGSSDVFSDNLIAGAGVSGRWIR